MKDLTEISVAPMMDWTDRHCRYFHRLIAPHVRLYTEMVTTGALLHGDAQRFLRFDAAEHPVALQLGGSEPEALARCAEMGAAQGYDEINLNCGCPSDRVQSGAFGACLMNEPATVAAGVKAMRAAVDIPVSVKCRIGIDEQDDFAFLDQFIGTAADAGCETFIIHARKAWLKGLSPKQNREVPPLDYERVAAIKEKYPALRVVLNGGITEMHQIQKFSSSRTCSGIHSSEQTANMDSGLRRNDPVVFDGFMIGREAYSNPYFLAEIEQAVFGHNALERDAVARTMIPYAQQQQAQHGTPIKSITRHILGLFHHQAGAKAWKRALSTLPYQDGAGAEVIEVALAAKNDAIRAQEDA